ncbi:MAG: 16S rRNA (cytosine(967)-C(5))-methyltransferase RsmB [Thermoleophilaceae bacterium]
MSGGSPARRCAHAVLLRVDGDGAFADVAFRAEADRARLDPRERAFAQRLAYGSVQRRATLDHVIAACSSRPLERIDPAVLAALRLGAYQLLYAGGVPDRAAVGESVELTKPSGAGAARFANAVLRGAARDGARIVDDLDQSTPEGAALARSHPDWLVRMWWGALGPEETLALLERDNEPPESAVRANELRTTAPELSERLAALGVPSEPAPGLPEGLVLCVPFDVHGSELFAGGLLMPQSRGSMLAARVVDPQPGESVLDLCAAPGGKATHLAALMRGEGRVVAVEAHPGRARALEENARRLGAARVEVRVCDAADRQPDGPFDRVLLDPPCSDLGTLQARPDVRWRKTPAQLAELAALQARLLARAAAAVRPGGVLAYSTCTISPRENEEQLRGFLEARPEFAADDLGAERPELASRADARFLQLLPHRHGTDGFFLARLRRTA